MNFLEKWWFGWWWHHCPKWLLIFCFVPHDVFKALDILDEKVDQLGREVALLS